MTCHPSEVSSADAQAWNDLRAAHPDYNSPLLSPEFARTVGQNRSDARVVLLHDEAGLAGVFAYFQRPGGLARSIGAPFSDYSGPVLRSDFGWSLVEIIESAGLSAWQTTSLVDPWDKFEAERSGAHSTMLITLDIDPADYLEQQRKKHAKRFKNFRRLDSQATRDGYELSMKWGAIDPALKNELFRYKSEQYVASGLVDLTDTKHSRAILDEVANSPNGFCIGLWAGDEFVSAHFGFRLDDVFHPWIAAYNPDFARYSPGNLLLKRIIENMPAMGLREYDLAEGHDHYKKYYISSERTVYHAHVTSRSLFGRAKSAQSVVWRLLGADRDGAATQRLRRRLDHVSASDPRFTVRVLDLFSAMRKRGIHQQAGPHVKSDA
ncbi:MAG: GNAT family N-acetyltransferase [Hyphomonas sp.]